MNSFEIEIENKSNQISYEISIKDNRSVYEIDVLSNNDYNKSINKPSINGVVLEGNKTTEELGIEANNNYENATNKPSINGVELSGNKTTEDLGITDVDLITKILPESIEEDLEQNQVYNGNAIHDLARLFGMALEEVKETIPKPIFDMSCSISLTDMTVDNITNYSEEIIEKKNQGYLVRLSCDFIENPKLKVMTILSVIDGDWVFFYPVIRGNIGQGIKNYIFRLGIGATNATIEAYDLSGGVDILTEFDIEKTYKDSEVYNANAIHQLLELFVWEITQIQEAVEQLDEKKEDKQVYIELNLNFNPTTAEVSIRDWITQNPYEVADEANKKGVPVIAKGYLYYNGNFLETVFLSQTLYSDSSFGRFKYFLGFTDDETMAYLRINKTGTSVCGLKKFE